MLVTYVHEYGRKENGHARMPSIRYHEVSL